MHVFAVAWLDIYYCATRSRSTRTRSRELGCSNYLLKGHNRTLESPIPRSHTEEARVSHPAAIPYSGEKMKDGDWQYGERKEGRHLRSPIIFCKMIAMNFTSCRDDAAMASLGEVER